MPHMRHAFCFQCSAVENWLFVLPLWFPHILCQNWIKQRRHRAIAYKLTLADQSMLMRETQLHAVVLAMFASIFAPFGGFFASGFKRGFKIKDFGDSIPGHGGMTDRMDCQVSALPDAA